MASKSTPAPAETDATNAAPQDAQGAEIPLSLDEFCTRLSSTDRRVEIIGGFHSEEAKSGNTKDVESAFLARFNEFINKPA